jgi:2-dehydropantoate 2-reductase
MIIHHGGRRIHLAQNFSNMKALATARKVLQTSGWRVITEKNEAQMLWIKLCINAAINPVGTLAHASNGEIMRNPELKKLSQAALQEAVLAAQSAGQKISIAQMKALLRRVCPIKSFQKNSMLQDMENRRKTEMRQILGSIFCLAKKNNIQTPILSRMFRLIQELEGIS